MDASKTRIGCSGWSYPKWLGAFYPDGMKQSDFLNHYSRVFNAVEIDSTFYRIPSENSVKTWYKITPNDFVFCPKIPQTVTHEKRFKNAGMDLHSFFEVMRLLRHKLGPSLFQLPPSLDYDSGFQALMDTIGNLDDDLKLAVEFRHPSWFRKDVYEYLAKKNVSLAWNDVPSVSKQFIRTSGDVYLRLVGDRTLDENKFGKILRNRDDDLGLWSRMILEDKYGIDTFYAFANNHYQGFGPGTVNILRGKLGLDTVIFKNNEQSTLF